MAGNVGIAHLVVAAPTEGERRRPLRIQTGKLDDLVHRDAGQLRSALDGESRLRLTHKVVYRGRLRAIDLDDAGKRRCRNLPVTRRCAGGRVDDEERVLRARFRLLRRRVFHMIAKQLARCRIHKERHGGMLPHEIIVRQPLVEDDADHTEEQRGVRAGDDGHPLIGFTGGRGEMRVDGDHPRAGFLGLEEQPHLRQRGLAEVAAHGEHKPGFRPIAGIGRGSGEAPAIPDRRVQAVAKAHVDAGEAAGTGLQDRGQKARVRLRTAHDHNGVLAMRGLDVFQRSANLIERLIPADLNELVGTTVANAFERCLHTLVAIDMLYLGNALQADGLISIVRARIVGLHQHHAAIAHRALQGAHAAAMRLMERASRILLRNLGSICLSWSQPCLSRCHTGDASRAERSRPADAFEKASAREPKFGRVRFCHFSSSWFVISGYAAITQTPHHLDVARPRFSIPPLRTRSGCGSPYGKPARFRYLHYMKLS